MHQVLFLLLTLTPSLSASDNRDALFEAARLGDVVKVKQLLDKGANVNSQNGFGATALWFAAYKNRADVVKLLLARKADPEIADNVWNATPLSLAASFDQNDVLKVLLAAKVKGTDSVLLSSASAGKLDLVRLILQHERPEADVLSSALLMTPPGSKDVIEHLKKAGAKPFPTVSAVDRAANKRFEGTYENHNGVRLTILSRDGVLLGMTNLFGLRVMRPVEKTDRPTFRLVGDPRRVSFDLKDGKVISVTAGPLTFDPVKEIPTATATGTYKDEPMVVRRLANWPGFRGEGATGVADGQHPPGLWDTKKLTPGSWKTPIPGLGHSCPVVWGNQVFITTAVSSDPKSELKPGLYGALTEAKDRTKHSWKVYCLDRTSGKILWEKVAYEGVPRVRRHIKATHANSTPVTDGKRLIVSFGSEGLYAYSLDGQLLWKRDLGILDTGAFNDADIQWEYGSSPALYNDLVIIQCDRAKESFLAAYQLDTGKPVWRTARDEPSSWGSPTVVTSKSGDEVVTNGTKGIRAYDPKTGKELWSLGRNSQITVPTPFVGDGLIFVTSGYHPIQPIYAIRPGGRGDLTLKDNQDSNEHIVWSKVRGGTYMPTPIYYKGYLYTCSNAGMVTCYEGRTGKQVYREKLKGPLGYTASPVAADGRLYFTGEDGKVSVVKAGPKFELLAVNDLAETTLATPAIAGGMLYFRTQTHLWGIGRKPG